MRAEIGHASSDSFRLTQRTLRFLQLAAAYFTTYLQPREQSSLLAGHWKLLHQRVELRSNGSGLLGDQPLEWKVQNHWIHISLPGQHGMIGKWMVDENRLVITPADDSGAQLVLERLAPYVGKLVDASYAALERSDTAFATALLQQCERVTRDADPWAQDVHRLSLRLATHADDQAAAASARSWLQARAVPLTAPRRHRDSESDVNRVLAAHLHRVVDLCRVRGARAVLLTYPHALDIDQAVAVTARQADSILIDNVSMFLELRKSHAYADLFIEDGHCNDNGYAYLAKNVSKAVRALFADR